jgi:hypothetical protein
MALRSSGNEFARVLRWFLKVMVEEKYANQRSQSEHQAGEKILLTRFLRKKIYTQQSGRGLGTCCG